MIFADEARAVGSFDVQSAAGVSHQAMMSLDAAGSGGRDRAGRGHALGAARPLFSLIQVKASSSLLRDALATVSTRGGEAHEL
jgi:hypothetical protein